MAFFINKIIFRKILKSLKKQQKGDPFVSQYLWKSTIIFYKKGTSCFIEKPLKLPKKGKNRWKSALFMNIKAIQSPKITHFYTFL